HVSHIITNVVGNDGGVAGIVFGNTLLHLAHQVSTHIGRLGEDATAYPGKQGNGGTTEAEAGDDFHENVVGKIGRQPGFHDQIDNHQAEYRQADKGKAHDRARVQRHLEGLADIILVRDGGPGVTLGGDHHADITGGNRDDATKEEGHCCIQPFAGIGRVGIIDKDRDDRGKHKHEDGEEFILLLQEGHGSLGDCTMNKYQSGSLFALETEVKRNAHYLPHVEVRYGQTEN